MCEQDYVSLSNAILHNSAVRTKHTRTHVRPCFVRLLVVQWVVISQYTMGWSLMDWSMEYFGTLGGSRLSIVYVVLSMRTLPRTMDFTW